MVENFSCCEEKPSSFVNADMRYSPVVVSRAIGPSHWPLGEEIVGTLTMPVRQCPVGHAMADHSDLRKTSSEGQCVKTVLARNEICTRTISKDNVMLFVSTIC